MKKIILIAILILLVGCSEKTCEQKGTCVNLGYECDLEIKWADKMFLETGIQKQMGEEICCCLEESCFCGLD